MDRCSNCGTELEREDYVVLFLDVTFCTKQCYKSFSKWMETDE